MTAPPGPKDRKAQQSEATRRLLVQVARQVFAERGYAEAGTDLIAQRAGLSRGALYHQFRDKEALFRAVYEELQSELIAAIRAAVVRVAQEPRWPIRMGAALGAYLDFFMEEGARRIVLQDAPSVLDWDTRNEIHLRHGLGALTAALIGAMEAGDIERQPPAELAHVIHGALNEGSMTIALGGGDRALRVRVGAAIDRLLAGLATKPGGGGADGGGAGPGDAGPG